MDYSGKIIRKNPVVPSQTSASGVWTLDEALQAQRSNTWPVANVPDPISRSLRFRSSASANLNRTNTATGDAQKFTWSGWIKRGAISSAADNYLFCSDNFNTSSNRFVFQIILKLGGGAEADTLVVGLENSVSGTDGNRRTTQVFRDPSAWYHIVGAVDTTQATAANRIRVYVNGVEVTAFAVNTNPNQNANVSINQSGGTPRIGAFNLNNSPTRFFDGYMTEVNFIDGQQLTPSSFGGTNAVTGVWEPRPYTGTYGTNGFLLAFSDITSTTTLGNDTSGNSNNWTTNNISLTAGSTYDSMLDVPTQWIGYNTGNVASVTRGNYAVMNPLSKGTTISVSSANLNTSMASVAWNSAFGTLGVSSGKWYWESTLLTSSGADAGVGISTNPSGSANSYLGVDANSWAYYGNNGNKRNSDVGAAYGATYTNGDVIGVALDLDAGTITFYKNNTSQGTAYSSLPANTYFPAVTNNNSSFATNFGQRPFTYTPPAGFVSLCTTNLPSPTILQGDDYFNIALYTGNSTARTISGVGFQPDFNWTKPRNAVGSHVLTDAVRGVTKFLETNSDGTEQTGSTGIQSWNSDGYALGTGNDWNITGETFVSWNWRASNAAGVTNTAGSITSTVSANTTAGFSVVRYGTGTGANATVGHGLGVAPSMIIVKGTDLSGWDWTIYHASLGNTRAMALNTTAAAATSSTFWNNTSPTSTVFSIGTNSAVNANTYTYIAYCFATVPGYSAFGSYTGTGSSDGAFLYTGFRPRFVLFRRTDSTGGAAMVDSARDPFNVAGQMLYPYGTDAEGTNPYCDLVSNGFKVRGTSLFMNASGGTYIYMAFAESPFKNALARQGINNRRNIMFAVVQNGQLVQVVQPDQPFTVGDKQYSARFIRNSTAQEKLDAGVWEVIDSGRPDDRYYWVTGPSFRVNEVNSTVEAVYTSNAKALEDKEEVDADGNPMFVKVLDKTDPANPVMVDSAERLVTKGLKSQNIAQVKQTAGSLLAQTDWYVVRKADIGTDVPADVVTYRAAIRAEADRLEAAIAAVTDVAGLIAVQADWPTL